jgi:hypothetical protein
MYDVLKSRNIVHDEIPPHALILAGLVAVREDRRGVQIALLNVLTHTPNPRWPSSRFAKRLDCGAFTAAFECRASSKASRSPNGQPPSKAVLQTPSRLLAIGSSNQAQSSLLKPIKGPPGGLSKTVLFTQTIRLQKNHK